MGATSKALLVGALALGLLVGWQGSALGAARLDRSFAKAGFAVYPNGGPKFIPPQSGEQPLVRDAEGRLLVGGFDRMGFAVRRYLPGGRPDRSFGEGGTATVWLGGEASGGGYVGRASALAVQPDGRILVAGNYEGRPQSYCEECSPEPEDPRAFAAIARLEPDGSLDPRFGGRRRGRDAGLVRIWMTAIGDLAVQGERILFAGERITPWPQASERGFLARLRIDGEADPSFGAKGWAWLPRRRGEKLPDSSLAGLVLGPGGSIYAGGTERGRFLLTRFTADGRLDRRFATAGIVRARVGQGCRCARGLALARDRRGRLLLAGHGRFGGHAAIALARFLPGGRLDRGFGTGGVAHASVGPESYGRGVAVQADGRIVVAGGSYRGYRPRFTVVRFRPGGGRDRSFFGGAFSSRRGGEAVQPLVDGAGRLLVAGEAALARFLLGGGGGR